MLQRTEKEEIKKKMQEIQKTMNEGIEKKVSFDLS